MTDATIYNTCKQFTYGFWDPTTQSAILPDDPRWSNRDYIHTHCVVLGPEQLAKYKVGTCWDMSLYCYQKLLDAHYKKVALYYMEYLSSTCKVTHTATIYTHTASKLWYWMECAWNAHMGIHGKRVHQTTLLSDITKAFCTAYKIKNPTYARLITDASSLLSSPMIPIPEYLTFMGSQMVQ